MSSCNVGNRNVHIVNSISHHTKPLSVGKSDCSRNVSKPVICKSLHIEPLNVGKFMSSCNVCNQNVQIDLPPPGKTTFKKPSLTRVNICRRQVM